MISVSSLSRHRISPVALIGSPVVHPGKIKRAIRIGKHAHPRLATCPAKIRRLARYYLVPFVNQHQHLEIIIGRVLED